MLKGLLDFVFPPLCLGCGAFNEHNVDVCEDCLNKIDTYSYPICLSCFEMIPDDKRCPICREDYVPLFAYGNYASPMQDVIIQFKFKGITSPARTFAALLYEQFHRRLHSLEAAMLVPVPLYPSREKYRGYNQAALFAGRMAELLDLPVNEDILFRIKKRKPQANLELKKRARNVRGVFAVDQETERGEKVILVDDVVTSGATVAEARKELEKAGYRVSGVVAIAHSR